jgi:hypothetical protein
VWITKGTLLGVWLFSFGNMTYLALIGYIPKPGVSFDVRTLTFETVQNPSWWLWLVVCLALGLIGARSWPGRGVVGAIVWIGLALTELVPVGVLAIILVMVSKLRAMAK